MRKTALILTTLCMLVTGCVHSTTSSENVTTTQQFTENPKKDAEWIVFYRNIIAHAEDYVMDPYELDLGYSSYLYLGLHDFDNNGTPEFIFGDSSAISIYTVQDKTLLKVADLQMTEDWVGINGVKFKDNTLLLINAGSDGCGYECFTYKDGYITGFYSDYEPEVATLNGSAVSPDDFHVIFNLEDLETGTYLEKFYIGDSTTQAANDLNFDEIILHNIQSQPFVNHTTGENSTSENRTDAGIEQETALSNLNDIEINENMNTTPEIIDNVIWSDITNCYQCSTNEGSIYFMLQRNNNEITGVYTNSNDDIEHNLNGSIYSSGIMELYNEDGSKSFVGNAIFNDNAEGFSGDLFLSAGSNSRQVFMNRTGFVPKERKDRYRYLQYTDNKSYETDKVESFAIEVKQHIKNRDIDALAVLIDYPLTIDGKANSIINAEDFHMKSPQIINDNFIDYVSKSSARNLSGNNNGLCLADGRVWFRYNTVENTLKIYAMNVSE